jgi:hypothetical protein
LSKQSPRLPIETSIPTARQRRVKISDVYWAAALVAVVDQAGLGAAARDGHLERVDDELGAEVVGDRPADDPAAVAVHHRGQVQPALPNPPDNTAVHNRGPARAAPDHEP